MAALDPGPEERRRGAGAGATIAALRYVDSMGLREGPPGQLLMP